MINDKIILEDLLSELEELRLENRALKTNSNQDTIEYLASFPILNPNPVLEVERGGVVTYYNPAAKSFLQQAGVEMEFTALLPPDLDNIMDDLRDQSDPEVVYREVKINDLVLGENIYLSDELNLTRIYAFDITERKLIEESMRKSRQDTLDILESILDPFYSVDSNWQLTYVNRKTAQMWNRRPEDLVGKVIWDVFPEQEHIQGCRELHRAMGERISLHFETFSPNLLTWVEVNIYPSSNGGLSVYFADINDRKQAEERLLQAEKDKSSILESITDAFFTFNRDWQVNNWNIAAEDMFKLSRDAVLGRNIWDVIPGAVGSEFYNQYQFAMNENQSVEFEAFGGHTRRWVEARAYPTRDGLAVYLRDITSRKEAEEALQRSHEELETRISERTAELNESNQKLRLGEERFKLALANSNTIVFNQNEDLRYTWVHNPIFGYTVEDLIGRTDEELFPLEDHSHLTEIKKRVLQTGMGLREEVRTMVQGEVSYRDIFVYPVFDAAGVVVGISCVSNDITHQKQIEREMARLDRLNLVGEMAASIGHEIRNPMTVVRGFIQLLTEQQCYEKDRIYFDLMIDELDRANGIISEYLGMARNKIIDRQPRNLDQVVKVMYPMIEADANYKGMKINLELSSPTLTLIDENEIKQLILNMSRNGMEAMSPGGLLTIGTYATISDVVLFIKDLGHGIEPELMEKLGTPFLTTKDRGTGLGLAVCYSIAARHNAKITCDSGPEGTTFYVYFPLQM
ncbi:MAG: PAS domain-containing protein [Firmicutes bacterium]|nr:PAS domain-containing protein [Bacillota bacterium]